MQKNPFPLAHLDAQKVTSSSRHLLQRTFIWKRKPVSGERTRRRWHTKAGIRKNTRKWQSSTDVRSQSCVFYKIPGLSATLRWRTRWPSLWRAKQESCRAKSMAVRSHRRSPKGTGSCCCWWPCSPTGLPRPTLPRTQPGGSAPWQGMAKRGWSRAGENTRAGCPSTQSTRACSTRGAASTEVGPRSCMCKHTCARYLHTTPCTYHACITGTRPYP